MEQVIENIDTICEEAEFSAIGTIAFRKCKTAEHHRYARKQLRCPICGARIVDIYIKTKIEIVPKPDEADEPCQVYLKCVVCGSDIGIRIL